MIQLTKVQKNDNLSWFLRLPKRRNTMRFSASLLLKCLFSFLILGSGCAKSPTPKAPEEQVRINIVRAFMSESDRFIFLVDGVRTEVVIKNIRVVGGKMPRIFRDVPSSESIWIKLEADDVCINKHHCSTTELEIHLHNETDLNSAGWNHGKFGQGETTVLE